MANDKITKDKKSVYSRRSKQCSRTIISDPPMTADVIKKKVEKVNITRKTSHRAWKQNLGN